MEKLTLLQETKNNTIDINGHVFDILISDDEVYRIPVEFQKKLESTEDVGETIEYINGMYDRVLGKDALKIISGGKPVPLAVKIEWFTKIFRAISKTYFSALLEKYE